MDISESWHDKTAPQVAEIFSVDPEKGLNRATVRKRRKEDGGNDLSPREKNRLITGLRKLSADYTSLLMTVMLLICAAFRSEASLYLMLGLVVLSDAVLLIADTLSDRAMSSIQNNALPAVTVLREGHLCSVNQRKLVRGDIILLSRGDVVPCDARLIESQDLEVFETPLTRVPHQVRKDASFIDFHQLDPSEMKNMVFATTIITKGSGRAICCETGSDNLVCRLGCNRFVGNLQRAALLDSAHRFSRNLSMVMTGMIVVVTLIDQIIGRKRALFDSFMMGLTLSASTLGGALPILVSVLLAFGIYHAFQKNKRRMTGAVIKNTDRLEMLSKIDCLVIPKEIGCTVAETKVAAVWNGGHTYLRGDREYRYYCSRVLRYALLSTGNYDQQGVDPVTLQGSEVTPLLLENSAILNAARECGEAGADLAHRYPIIEHRAVDGNCLFDTTLVTVGYRFIACMRGDYRDILPRCSGVTVNRHMVPLDDTMRRQLYEEAGRLIKKNCRVIAVATKSTIYNNLKRISVCHYDMVLEGLVAVEDPLLPGVSRNIELCRKSGIRVIMTTEDVSEYNRSFAENIGLVKSNKNCLNGFSMQKMQDQAILSRLDKVTLYQGLSVAQKSQLIRLLRSQGCRVGYLMIGLSDVALSREVDCSFSVGQLISESGDDHLPVPSAHEDGPLQSKSITARKSCEALKYASDVVLSPGAVDGTGGFNGLLLALISSKTVYHNLGAVVRYLVSSQAARVLLVFASCLCGLPLLTPAQILFSGLFIDLLAVMTIALDKPVTEQLVELSSTKHSLPGFRTAFRSAYLTYGLITAMLCSGCVAVARYAVNISFSNAAGLSFITYLLCQFYLACIAKRVVSRPIPKNFRTSGSFISLFFLLIGFSVMTLTASPIGRIFNVSTVRGFRIMLPFLAALLLPVFDFFLLPSVARFLHRKHKDMPNKPVSDSSAAVQVDSHEDEDESDEEIRYGEMAEPHPDSHFKPYLTYQFADDILSELDYPVDDISVSDTDDEVDLVIGHDADNQSIGTQKTAFDHIDDQNDS